MPGLLVGDVGGTNVRLAIARRDEDGRLTVSDFQKMPGDNFDTLYDAISLYLSESGSKPEHAVFALAGPLKNGTVTLTNRPWSVSETTLKRRFDLKTVALFNDFAAMGRSIPEMYDSDFEVFNHGQPMANTPMLVAGPGTGFGVALLVPTVSGWKVVSTEGGHQAYSASTPLEIELLKVLRRDHDYVSLELVASGMGLDTVHKAMCEIHKVKYEALSPEEVRTRADAGDAVCHDVCRLRAEGIMGALGDLTLSTGARGGAILAGGVAERMIDLLSAPGAMNRFFERGPRTAYMEDIPVKLLHNGAAPLTGAAALYFDGLKYDA